MLKHNNPSQQEAEAEVLDQRELHARLFVCPPLSCPSPDAHSPDVLTYMRDMEREGRSSRWMEL